MSHHESAARGPDSRMVDRMLFFTDAVFAIVLTLLAIELHPPEIHRNEELWPELAAMGPKFMAFAISFALIGLWWSVHMRTTRRLIAFDWLTAVCNLLALSFITLLPFASALFGENPTSETALQVYWMVSAAAALAMTLLFLVMTRDGGRLVGGIGAREWWGRFVMSLAPGIAFSLGVYFSATGQVWLARFAWVLIFPVMLLGRLIFREPRVQPKPA
jgi:uncharacterized membrane protein